MDRSLDETIADRRRYGNRDSRDRRQNWPRDGVRKSSQRDDSRNLDRDWVHDRYDGDSDSRRPPRSFRAQRSERYSPETEHLQTGAKIRVDNLHYDLTEDDIRELFNRIGPVNSVSLLYDRQDRSKGIAFVNYAHLSDARIAIREYDGANANGQPIRLTLVPTGSGKPARNPFDTAERPSRSLFDRISEPVGRRHRSASPDDRRVRHSDVTKPPPDHIDRYVPGERTRSPNSRRGRARELGRRPGARRDDSGRVDRDGRPMVQGRPRKTAEELDAEMEDYWGPKAQEEDGATVQQNGNGVVNQGAAAPAAAVMGDDDVDMIE